MKKFLKVLSNIKIMAAIVFVGMLILFLMGKAIFYQQYECKSLDVLWLMIMAMVIAGLKIGTDYKVDCFGLNRHLATVLLGIFVVGFLYLANWVFGLFALQGIQYLYFGLIMIGLYVGACFGFWVVGKLEVHSLNTCLNVFKQENSTKNF